jgi:hypothetical protein
MNNEKQDPIPAAPLLMFSRLASYISHVSVMECDADYHSSYFWFDKKKAPGAPH